MNNFLRKNNKKLLAVFAVGLMIVFILPSTFTGQGDMANPLIGEIGGDDDETDCTPMISHAQQEWQVLSRIPGPGPLRGLPITFLLASPAELQNVMMALQMGRQSEIPMPRVISEIQAHPEMYLLLQEEARRMGIVPSPDQVETIVSNQVPADSGMTPDRMAHIRQSVRNFLSVIEAKNRVSSAVKVSEPLRRHAVAQEWQQMRVNVAEFKTSEFASAVPAPTDEQLHVHYEKYKDLDPNSLEARGNGGFGYRLPDRVKLQYLEIPINAVEEAVRAKKSAYDWDVAAAKYYAQNQDEFPATPSTQPTTQQSGASDFTLGATSQPTVAASGPTTRPFEEVKTDVVNRLVRADAQKLALAIQNQVQAMLANDYRENSPALTSAAAATAATLDSATTQPTTVPASGFAGHEYLQKVADSIEKQFGVRPNVTSRGDSYLGLEDLSNLPGIGNASGDRTPFAHFVMSRAEAFAPQDATQASRARNMLSDYEPPLTDFVGNVYFFRITDAEASRPAPFDEVRPRVEQDWRTAQAYDLANQAAEKLLAAAKESNLASAAKAANRAMITTGKFTNRAGASIENYTLPTAANGPFVHQAYKLLNEAAQSGREHPLMLIPLPEAQRVIVAELESVEPVWDKDSYAFFDLRTGQELAQVYDQSLQSNWFSFDKLKQRLNYVPTEPDNDEEHDHNDNETPAPPRGPQPLF